MEKKKRAIILDMDETLEHGIHKREYGFIENDAMMVLRPGLDELIAKLQEAKSQGIDIILCTTAYVPWVERFLNLKPEFKRLFNTRLTGDTLMYWMDYSERRNPLEYGAKQKDPDLRYSKPVTTFGYDSVLFIDNNMVEADRLKRLFEITQGKLEKDVTFFSSFGFWGGDIELDQILGSKKRASQRTGISQKLTQYLAIERCEPGCHMMCSAIDKFIGKSFVPGLTLVDEEYSEEYNLFQKKRDALEEELEELLRKSKEKPVEDLFEFSDNEIEELLAELKEYMSTDKKYPYEGIEVEQREGNKREKFSKSLQVAVSRQTYLEAAKKLEVKHQQHQSPGLE